MFQRICALFALTLLLASCGSVNQTIEVADGERIEGNLRSVNGSVIIGAEAEVTGNANSVNGHIRLGPDSRAGELNTVNGRIELGERAQARQAETVNGRIRLDAGARVEESVSTVNGRIELGPGAAVSGRVSAVNGRISLDGAEAGSLSNVRGGIIVDNGSRVLGELIVRRSSRQSGDPPLIQIGADSEVVGPLRFEQPVNLRVHESATIGMVEGAEPEYYRD